MKTIIVKETVEKQIEFPFAVPCVFKYSERQDHPLDLDEDDFWSCLLVKVDHNYNISSIKISKNSLFNDYTEYDFTAKSCYNIGDIISYNMIPVTDDWWDSAKKVVFDYWKDK